MEKLRGLFILDEEAYEMAYGPDERRAIGRYVDFVAPPQTVEAIAQRMDLLSNVQVIFSGWKAPVLDERFLAAAPQLRVVFYAAGSTGNFVTDAAWNRGVIVTSAYAANAIPVAEYTLSMILFSLKHGWRMMREAAQFPPRPRSEHRLRVLSQHRRTDLAGRHRPNPRGIASIVRPEHSGV